MRKTLNRTIQIEVTPAQKASWKKRIGFFIAAFSVLWLLAGPLVSLASSTPLLGSLQLWGYVFLILLSGLATAIRELMVRRGPRGRRDYMRLRVLFVKSGTEVDVGVPRDLEVGVFVDRLLSQMSASLGVSTEIIQMYHNNLMVRRNNRFVTVESGRTLRDAKLREGTYARSEATFASSTSFLACAQA